MKRYAVVCGLLRFPLEAALTLRRLFQLRADGLLDGIVLSTWSPEVERERDFTGWMRRNGVEIVHSTEHPDRGPTMLYTQSRAVWLGLQAVPQDADVLKLRTDKTFDKIEGFVPLLAEGTDGDAFAPGPHAAYARKVAVLWPHVGRPFYFGDQAYYATRADAAAALNFDARYHLMMEGLNPETKWWIRPIYEKFAFWRGYFGNVDQMRAPDAIRAALARPDAAPPAVLYDLVAATLHGMADNFLFTVRNPASLGTANTGRRYSDLFAPPGQVLQLAYEAIAAGRRTMSLRDGADLPALVAGQVDPCPLSDGVRQALAAQAGGPPVAFDHEAFRSWIAPAAPGQAVAPRPFTRLDALPALATDDEGPLLDLVGDVAGGAPPALATELLAVIEQQLTQGLPVSRALFRTALIMERRKAPASVVNTLITQAASQKINEAAIELAVRALEDAEGVSAELALRFIAPSCDRGLPEALVLRALLAEGHGTAAADPKLAATAWAAARLRGSADAAVFDALRAGQDVPEDLIALQSFGQERGLSAPAAAEFARRVTRLRLARGRRAEAVPG